MKALFDTSVLVAAVVAPHPYHNRALPWLQKAKKGEIDFYVASHTLAELYAVLTTLPVKPRISPEIAWHLVHDNIDAKAKIISLTSKDYKNTIKEISEKGLSGGIIYDALIAKAAKKARVDRLLTFNPKDFLRVWPEGKNIFYVP